MRAILVLILLILLLYGLLHVPRVQTWLVKKVAGNLSEKLHTKVTLQAVDFRFFDRIVLDGLMIQDQKKDTLLYAGEARADVTDWFFLKDRIVIKNIGLTNATVNINREDSVWNYKFILDYFSHPKKPNAQNKPINLDLRELHFENLRFIKHDGWIGQDMVVSLAKTDAFINAIDFDKQVADVSTVDLVDPYFSQSDYDGRRPEQPDLQNIIRKIPVVSTLSPTNSGWQIRLGSLTMENGGFKNDKQTTEPPYPDRFDGSHLLFTEINGKLDSLLFRNDTLTVRVALAAKERSGLVVKKLQARMRMTSELMEFNQLDLQTNCSRLRDYYAMRFADFTADFNSFIHNVSLSARFRDSYVCSSDLAIFAPALKSWKQVFSLQGKAEGTLDNFSATDMQISDGRTLLQGSFAMRGLPDIDQTFIDFHAKQLRTNYADMVSLVPALKKIKTPDFARLGTIGFAGDFTGFIHDFVSYGTFNTALGTITADVNMKTPEGRPTAYSGHISSTGFRLGSFLHSPVIGNVALDAKIAGAGFSVDELRAKVDGTISTLQLGNYTYHSLIVDGDVEKKVFIGHLSIDDPNLQIESLDGAFNISTKHPDFKVTGLVRKADLFKLGFTLRNFVFGGALDLDFTGNNIDNFLGTARITNASLQVDTNHLSFDSLMLRSEIVAGQKSLSLFTNEAEANVTGNFTLKELPQSVELLLSKYYPSYISPPRGSLHSNQDFSFRVKTYHADPFVRLLDPRLGGFDNATITGSFNLKNNAVSLDADLPQIVYDGKTFTGLKLKANGTKDTLLADMNVADIIVNDSMHFPNTTLHIAAANDNSAITLDTRGTRIFGDAELNATVQTLPDGVKIHFYPSSFIVNNKKWQLDKDGELTIQRRFFEASEVKFFHDNQALILTTEKSGNNNSNLVARLQNLDISDFRFLLPAKPALQGIVSGTAVASDLFGKPQISFSGAADSFALDGSYVGRVNIVADANTGTGLINFKTLTAEEKNDFSIKGSYNYKDSTGNSLAIQMNASKLDLSVLQPYLTTIFSSLSGTASGDMQLIEKNNNLAVIGDPVIHNGSMRIAYTQVRYVFDNEPIRFGNGSIDLGDLTVHDTLGNTGLVSGKMYHNFFHDFSFKALRFSTDKMLLLNTTKKDNSSFYGHVIGRANMTLNGDIANMQMKIDGEPAADDSSHIYLPTGESKESSVIDYIDFIKFGSLMETDDHGPDVANLTVDMDLTANPACKIDVILDEETGDIIKGTGNGKLQIRVGTLEPLSIRGRYDITRGDYTFNFQTLLQRPFTLTGGSITWTGDPYLARLDMSAEYLAKNVDLSAISSTPNIRQQTDLRILSHITGSLLKPSVNFELLLPENSEYNRDFYIVKRLADFRNDENEMNKQVASLLLFNQFISTSQAVVSGESTLNIATGTIGGVISGWLTNVLSKALEKATNGVISPYIDLNPSVNLAQVNQLEANVRAGLTFRFSENLRLLVGGNLDYNNPIAQLYSKGVITPDISLQWLLNKDGSLRVVAFNRTTIDFTTGQRNRTGIQFGYHKDVDRLGDIFRSRKKTEKTDSLKKN